jgi:hypothetical protein
MHGRRITAFGQESGSLEGAAAVEPTGGRQRRVIGVWNPSDADGIYSYGTPCLVSCSS